MSCLTTSAMRRSRRVCDAVSTAFLAASSHEFGLVPITSTTLYTVSIACFFFAMRSSGRCGLARGPKDCMAIIPLPGGEMHFVLRCHLYIARARAPPGESMTRPSPALRKSRPDDYYGISYHSPFALSLFRSWIACHSCVFGKHELYRMISQSSEVRESHSSSS